VPADLSGGLAYPLESVAVNVLLVSADPTVRETMALCVRGVRRLAGETDVRIAEASDGVSGMKLAWRDLPDVVVVDEIASRAGAFAVARDLKGSLPPFPGRVVILLDRPQDAWLARWSGADAWFTKPVNPFDLAETVAGFLAEPEKEAV
jgi:DNA-binding NarL/FixJ family response regulator